MSTDASAREQLGSRKGCVEQDSVLIATEHSFADYRRRFAARAPDLATKRDDDELRQISSSEGLEELASPPSSALTGVPPRNQGASGTAKYLWAIAPGAVPFALEDLPGARLARGRLSHTNLTGGGLAHCAGEMWFTEPSRLIINGGSGRYPPRSEAELQGVARSFKSTGFEIAHMGWDVGVNRAARYLRGDPAWL